MRRAAALLLALAACAGSDIATDLPPSVPSQSPAATDPSSVGSPPTTAVPTAVVATTSTMAPDPIAPRPDFSKQPFLIFAPVPPQPDGAPASLPDGAEDFHALFEEGAAWQDALASIDAFKLHSWMVRHYFTDDELIRISDFLNAHGVPLIIEAEPLDPPDPDECDHTESFEGPYEIENARRLREIGVEVAAYEIEQPFSYGHKLEGPGSCNYELDRVLDEVVAWSNNLRRIFPDIQIGSIEALWNRPATTAADYGVWLDAWTEAMGEPPAFQHVDVDWAIPNWPETLRAIEDEVESRGVPFGPLYNGSTESDNDGWIDRAMENIATYQTEWGGTPGHVSIQSWNPQPDRLLPDDDPHAMTNLILRYLGARPTFADVAVDPEGIGGTLVDQDAVALAGKTIDVVRPPGGDRQILSITGTVPPGATEAVMLYRANFEDSIDAAVDATIHTISYVEDDSSVDMVPGGSMSRSEDGWGIYDDNAGAARFVSDDGDGALRLTASQGERLLVDGTSFTVRPGARYRIDVDVTVSDATSHGVIGLGFLADGTEFQRITLDLIGEPVLLGTTTTDATGAFRLAITDFDPASRIEISTPGDAQTWQARFFVT